MKKVSGIETDQDFNELWAECMEIKYTISAAGTLYPLSEKHMCPPSEEINPANDMSQCWMLVERFNSLGGSIEEFAQSVSPYFGDDGLVWVAKAWIDEVTGWAMNKSEYKAIILSIGLALQKIKK